jgi:hypothetical protein
MALNYILPRKPRAGDPIRAGWADSVVKAASELRPIQVPGMLISRGTYGTAYTPEAEWRQTAAEEQTIPELRPFDCRWMSFDTDDGEKTNNGEWQIYLPAGCVTVQQGTLIEPYIPTNEKARDADGNTLAGWYKIDDPDDTALANITDANDYYAETYSVYIEMKPWPRMKASVDPKAFNPTQWSHAVATISKIKYSDEEVEDHATGRLADFDSIAESWPIDGPFAVKYTMPQEGGRNPDAEPEVSLINQERFAGRMQVSVEKDTDVKEWKSVWIKIAHDSEKFSMSVEKDLGGDEAKTDDDQTVYKIYTLDQNVVTSDLRGSVPAMDFYVSPAKPEGDDSPAKPEGAN